ncbi:hypothetical protein MKW92_046530 [Papaver armeniacum]|nr:hypothetical protein MKW92_046530 [Papaver armeniacum]
MDGKTILVGDDLMTGPPSPIIPPEIASHVLEGVETCLQINDIEPFCQDEIVIYKQCVDKRSEDKLGLIMPLDDQTEPPASNQSHITGEVSGLIESFYRRLILASGAEGMDGFRQRWSLHGRLEDTKKRLESLKQGMEKREKKEEPTSSTTSKKGWFS